MIALQTSDKRWAGRSVIVAAPGPSLTEEVAAKCKGFPVIAVSDAHRLLPRADILYSADAPWWGVHEGAREFKGERWTSHGNEKHNNKTEIARKYGLKVVRGTAGDTFSLDPTFIHYGQNSGFQAINLAIFFGATAITLVGFNMQAVGGKRHFFGDHPETLNNKSDYGSFIPCFRNAAHDIRKHGITIINATPQSALDCFPKVTLGEALRFLEAMSA